MDIKFAFATIVVGLLGLIWVIGVFDILLGFLKTDVVAALTSHFVSLSSKLPVATFSAILTSYVVGFSFFVGAVLFAPADQFFDWGGLPLMKADDDIKASVYWDKYDQWSDVKFPEELSEEVSELKKLKRDATYLNGTKEWKDIDWASIDKNNDESLSRSDYMGYIKSIYYYQKFHDFTKSGDGYAILHKEKDQLTVLRGFALNGAMLTIISILALLQTYWRSSRRTFWPAHVSLLLLGLLIFSAGAYGVNEQEEEYDEQVIGIYRSLQWAAVPDDESGSQVREAHLWHDLSIGENAPGIINALIEIPKGSTLKKELDPVSGVIILDRIVEYGGGYPINYGSIPQTLSGDFDPLDVMVIGDPIDSGKVESVVVLAIMKMTDEGEQDDKILARPVDLLVDEARLMAAKQELLEWFTNYKGPGIISFEGWGDEDEAKRIIKESWDHWARIAGLFGVRGIR